MIFTKVFILIHLNASHHQRVMSRHFRLLGFFVELGTLGQQSDVHLTAFYSIPTSTRIKSVRALA